MDTSAKGNEIWNTALGEIETKVNKPIFKTWFKYPKTKGKDFSDNVLIVETENGFVSNYLESRMYSLSLIHI